MDPHTQKFAFERRRFLQSLSAFFSAMCLPLAAHAQVRSPKRVVFFYGGSGALPGHWEPLPPPGQSVASEHAWMLNDLHLPLRGFERELIYFEHLDMVSALIDPTPAANAHLQGATHALTGANRSSPERVGDISIDQSIAQALRTTVPTALPSLEVAASNWFDPTEDPAIAISSEQLISPQWDPREVHARLTRNAGQSVASLQRRQRVYEFVQRRLSFQMQNASREERQALEQHRAALADLQQRLRTTDVREALVPQPAILDAIGTEVFRFGTDAHRNGMFWRWSADLNLRLLVSALHANLTSVATFVVHDAPDALVGYVPGQHNAPNLHELTHRVNDPQMPHSRDPAAIEVLRQQHLRTSELFATLLRELASRTEPDGSRLLDHTVVLWMSRFAHGGHSVQKLPWVLAGSCQGFFRTGRYLRFPQTHRGNLTVGRPHNDLLVSIANAMGVAQRSFGNPDACSGPITALHRNG